MIKSKFSLVIAFAIFAVASAQLNFTYKSVDNLNLSLLVSVPSTSSFSKYPVIFGIHGGAYVEGLASAGYSQQELLEILSLGYVAVSIDYRLSPGVMLPDIVEDVQDAYNWVRTELPKNVSINPDAIIVWGRSAGGGLSVISGYMLSPRPKAVISWYPYCTNFTERYAYDPTTPVSAVVIAEANLLRKPIISEYDWRAVDPRNTLFLTSLSQGKAGWVLTTSDPTLPSDQILAILKNYSAVYHVDKDYPPTYLIHGLADTLVPYNQSIEMQSVLNATGIDNVLSLVPGVGHAFDDGVTDPTSQMWQQYIQPVFNFAKSIFEGDAGVQRDYITN